METCIHELAEKVCAQLTDTQKERLYRRLFERMKRGDGYQPYGWDWVTMKTTKPGFYTAMRAVWATLPK